jgi:hypothetical protein
MDQKTNFYESEVCTSQLHCPTCRTRHAGRKWRRDLRKTYRLPTVDFDCPQGKDWIEDRATTDGADTKAAKNCGGCGKTKTVTAPTSNTSTSSDTATGETAESSDDTNSIWEAASPPLYGETRASCMECVEKHIGAAMVLLFETKTGYPHYLLAVGHLHEAEEESQAWPDLAAAIRAMRKEMQTTGTVPDWKGVIEMTELMRKQ